MNIRNTFCAAVLMSLLLTSPALADTVIPVFTPAALGANDAIRFAQLGGDGASIAAHSSLRSDGGRSASLDISGGSGLVSVQCPASPQCSWTGGFAAGDSLVWSINGSSFGGTAPLGFLLDPTRGVGAFVQADNPGPFTVQLQWFDSHGSPGGSFLATSPLGDPIFIGALDLNPNNGIGAVAFNLTDGTNDLAVDSLQLNYFSSTQVPEPNLLVMLGSGIASLIGIRRWGKVSASDKN